MSGYFNHRLDASTPDEAEARLRVLYGDVRLDGLGGYRETAEGDDLFTVAQVDLDGRFVVEAEVDRLSFASSTPGHSWQVGRDEGDMSAGPVVFQHGEPMSAAVSGRIHATTVSFDLAALTDFAGALYGESTPIWFEEQRAVNAALGRHWMRLATFMRDGAPLENDLVRASAFRALAVGALEGFRLAGERTRRTRTAEARRRAYDRATRFIDDHLSLPITVADVAREAGVSEAELRETFRAHAPAAEGPAEKLRRGRLAAAHRDLVAADPTRGDTVAIISARWGFTHQGRFAAMHRRAYGTNPRHVLDR